MSTTHGQNSSAQNPLAETAPAVSDFHGFDELVRRFDHAVGLAGVDDITAEVQATLTDMLSDGRVELPAEVIAPIPGKYARRLIYRSDELGYAVIAMIWGPGQGTKLHDHDGVWCVEGVLQAAAPRVQRPRDAGSVQVLSHVEKARFRRVVQSVL